ncbi:Late competence development protein ComFB [Geosporobacter subterraneus DSM 17957]|uniref:Late competence development protein ComFB n=1 Tax=Geosporobacter subterraneus DSM 17957 TaxID=1121919 RepID=A0A1M6PR79_9FIRM|nr:late competence development ComFB family protein [Geosporobacter subterraneus]SHK10489.1 Late competence development protein ComFB [Geosporobacter subterraneus DSM 17957]
MFKNYTEILVREVISEYKRNHKTTALEAAEEDIIKTVLNRMQPKYFLSSSTEGEKKAYLLDKQLRLNALIEIAAAAGEVCHE